MTKSPMLWGAGLACALGGVVAGNALGSTPMLDRPTITSFFLTPQGSGGPETDHGPLPDHYPLVTRSGAIAVEELAMRGLYSQARYRDDVYAADYPSAEATADGYQLAEDSARYQGDDASAASGEAASGAGQAGQDESEPAAPLELAAGPANGDTQGRAKLIDVEATLALR